MNLLISVKNENLLEVTLKNSGIVIDHLSLTVSQNLDTLLIRTIDNIVERNRISRLSLKTYIIQGKMRPGSVSALIIKMIKAGLEV